MHKQRALANARAREILARRRPVTSADVLEVLRRWGFQKNRNRPNVHRKKQQWVHSDNLGLTRSRTGRVGVTDATKKYPDVTRLFSRWLQDHHPKQLKVRVPFTSIAVNKGFAANRHRDASNEGPSVIRSFGQFSKGGELLYWPADGGTQPVDKLCYEDKVVMDVSQGFALLDGRRAHEVSPFEGERYSLSFYPMSKFWEASKAVQKEMQRYGINFPSLESFSKVKDLLERGQGFKHYAGKEPQSESQGLGSTKEKELESAQKQISDLKAKLSKAIARKYTPSKARVPKLAGRKRLRKLNLKLRGKSKVSVQTALHRALELEKFCSQTAMGGGYAIKDRGNKPNGTGFTAKFYAKRNKIEVALKGAPKLLQKRLETDIKMMYPKSEGGRFDSKSRWIYMEPLQRIVATLREARAV